MIWQKTKNHCEDLSTLRLDKKNSSKLLMNLSTCSMAELKAVAKAIFSDGPSYANWLDGLNKDTLMSVLASFAKTTSDSKTDRLRKYKRSSRHGLVHWEKTI